MGFRLNVTEKIQDYKTDFARGSRVDWAFHLCGANSRVLAKLRSLLHSSCILWRADDRRAEEWDSDPGLASHAGFHRNDFRGLSKTPSGEARRAGG